MRVVICGSRDWVDEEPIRELIHSLKDFNSSDILTIVTGGAKGADNIAEKIAKEEGLNTMTFRAKWHTFGRAAGPIRNQEMLDTAEPERVYAFKTKLKSVGTDDCLKRARDKGIDTQEYVKEIGWM